MSEIRGVVVAHGNLAHCLVATTESISGISGALFPISNAGCSPGALASLIRGAIGEDAAVIFVDLASGSCAHAARLVGHEEPRSPVVSGVNLPMLLDFVFHLELEAAELAERVAEKGRSGTVVYLPHAAP
jgi:mannose/fructose-specific phosphotransferase system component IIA